MNRLHRALLAAPFLLLGPMHAAEATDPVRVQVVLRDTDREPGVLRVAAAQKDGGNRFAATVGAYPRGELLAEAFRKVWPARYPVFAVETVVEAGPPLRDADRVRNARDAGMRYVLLVDETYSGLSSGRLAADDGKVAVSESVDFELFDTATGRRMDASSASADSVVRLPLAQAMASGDFYRAQLPRVDEVLVAGLVGALLRTDNLHAMADAGGHGDAVPAVASVLAEHADAVVFRIDEPEGWRSIVSNSPYAISAQPRSDLRFRLGVRFGVDLLVPEFGQDVATLEDYMALVTAQMAGRGMDPASFAPLPASLLTPPPGYVGLIARRAGGTGGEIVLFKLLEKPYVSITTVIALEDLDGLVAANRADIEHVLRESVVRIDHAVAAKRQRDREKARP